MEEVTPITREEKIIFGEDIQPITRMEYFLKRYSGGSSAGNASAGGIIDVTELPTENIDEKSIYRVDTNGIYTYHACKNRVWVEFVTQKTETFETVTLNFWGISGSEDYYVTYTNSEGEEKTELCQAGVGLTAYDVKCGTYVSISGNYSSVDLVLNGGETFVRTYEYNETIFVPNNLSDTLDFMIIV